MHGVLPGLGSAGPYGSGAAEWRRVPRPSGWLEPGTHREHAGARHRRALLRMTCFLLLCCNVCLEGLLLPSFASLSFFCCCCCCWSPVYRTSVTAADSARLVCATIGVVSPAVVWILDTGYVGSVSWNCPKSCSDSQQLLQLLCYLLLLILLESLSALQLAFHLQLFEFVKLDMLVLCWNCPKSRSNCCSSCWNCCAICYCCCCCCGCVFRHREFVKSKLSVTLRTNATAEPRTITWCTQL